MLALKTKATLEKSIGRCWLHKGTAYTFNDFAQVGDTIIISTDIKALSVPVAQVDTFLAGLLPVDDKPAKNGHSAVGIPGVESTLLSELTAGLMASFREVQGSKDPKFLKEAAERAKTKVLLSKAVTDIAKTAIAGQKALREK